MQSTQSETSHPANRGGNGISDFDFGKSRPPRSRKRSPGLVAGVIAFAFAISMFIPVTSKADQIWRNGPDVIAEPHRPDGSNGFFTVESPRRDPSWDGLSNDGKSGWGVPDWDRPSNRIPAVCSLQIEGRDGGFNWYSGNCMRDYGVRGELPRKCSVNASLFGQRDRLYPADCLRRAGFELRGN